MSKFSYLLVLSLLILVLFTPRIVGQSDSPRNLALAEPSPNQESGPSAAPDGNEPRRTPHLQSPEEARAKDLALIAAARGWTIEQAAAHERDADILRRIAPQIADQRPAVYIGAALSPDAEGHPSIYIKGPADDFIRDLVAGAGTKINIVDNQPFSLPELEQRRIDVNDALYAMGFWSASASFRFEGAGQIEATVMREPGLPDNPDEILAGIPESLRDSVTLTVRDEPVSRLLSR